MNGFEAILLGIVQGLTEFLPVSSSAHLALVPYWFGWDLSEEQVFLFGVLIQMGTLAAVIIYFWHDILTIVSALFKALRRHNFSEDPNAQLGLWLILATIPAGLAGILLKDTVEAAFNQPRAIAIFLLVTALILFLAERWQQRYQQKRNNLEKMNWLDALWIGMAQILALFPGISRSGATISAGLTRGFKRQDAGRFSFLMSIPIMAAAGLFSLLDVRDITAFRTELIPLLISATAAAIVGYFSIRWLLQYVQKNSFRIFSVYCAAAGVFNLILTLIR